MTPVINFFLAAHGKTRSELDFKGDVMSRGVYVRALAVFNSKANEGQ